MLKFYRIGSEQKTFKAVIGTNEHYLPALYIASAKGDKVAITTEAKWLGNLTVEPVGVEQIYIEDVQQTDVSQCVVSLNNIINFKSGGGGGVSPEVLKDYVREVPKPDSTSAIVKIANNNFYAIGIASNRRTYFIGDGSMGIKVLNDATGLLEDTNIEYGNFYGLGIASNGKTYFLGYSMYGIKVLNDATGLIEDTNIEDGDYNSMLIASNGKTYFAGYGSGIKVLNDSTGLIEDTNIEDSNCYTIGIASNGRTYFSKYGIKVLNDSTGLIEDTNIEDGTYNLMLIASNGRTYFYGEGLPLKVLNDATGIIEDTNIPYCYAAGIASNGKTYFSEWGIKVLNDETGMIEDTNITFGNYYAIGIASNGRTYFIGDGTGIKVLNDETGIIENTNNLYSYFNKMGIASDGKTYFFSNGSGEDGIKVLNDSTGLIEDTNIEYGNYNSMLIASNGKTYFAGSVGLFILEITPVDEAWLRKYGEWLPVEDIAVTHEDLAAALEGKVNISDIVDNLASNDSAKPLSAKQGKELKVMIDAANGSGGFIEPNDFGSATPTQQALTDYAMNYIFGSDAPSHDPTEIFNGTKVQNLNDYRVWDLANTPNSTPPVFEWMPALVVSEAQRNFTANPIVGNEITDNAVSDAKIGNRTLTDAAAANTLPATGALTTILQTVRNCLKWLVNQFNASTGHSHNGTDSKKVSYNDLDGKPNIPAAQVNSDWNAASGVAQILNKPTSLPANGGNADTLTNQRLTSEKWKIWVGTEEQFNAIATKDSTTLYFYY
jgi:hypothetical protein